MDADSERCEELARKGIIALYGDAANSEVLTHAGLSQARALVVTGPDEDANALVVTAARAWLPSLRSLPAHPARRAQSILPSREYNRAMRTPEQLSAELYDASTPDWEREMDFYRQFALQARDGGQSVLEVACGTGRVTIRLAREGMNIFGADLDEEMLTIARLKSGDLSNVRWVKADMRTLDLGEAFGLIIVPGHSFQFMCTPEDQVKALEAFKRHLIPGGTLILHTNRDDVEWLAGLIGSLGGRFEPVCDVRLPGSNCLIRKSNAWTYEQYTQTATVVTRWQEIGEDGSILRTWERKPLALHCVFPFEMAHLLARTGFKDPVVHGDFFRNPLSESGPDMIWVARKA